MSPGDVLVGKHFVNRAIGRGGKDVVVDAQHAELHERVTIKVPNKCGLDHTEAVAVVVTAARVSSAAAP